MTNEIIFFDATEPRRERMRAGGARAKQETRDEVKPVDHAPQTVSYSFNAPTPVAPETNREEAKPVLRPAAPEPEQVAEPVAKQQETTGISADELDAYLVNFVVEQTGYPEEMVELDADLEGDLGIDSIKKAQLLGELNEMFHFSTAEDMSGATSIDDFNTLRDIRNFMLKRLGGASAPNQPEQPQPAQPQPAQPQPVQEPVAAPQESAGISADELDAYLVNFVVEQTGYPEDMVELDADLEGDLGIDSIKKAQLLGELNEMFHFSTAEDMSGATSIDDFNTLRDIRNFMLKRLGGAPAQPAPTQPAQPQPAPEPVAAPQESAGISADELDAYLVNFVVEQTGYPEDMVELDADLEGDLGIDSIKKAQLLGELNEMFHFSTAEDMAGGTSIDDFNTLRDIRDFMLKRLGGSTAPAAHATKGEDENEKLKEIFEYVTRFILDQTGYPEDRVDLDADLEADLGIDSIKKAQLFGELAEFYSVFPLANHDLKDFNTLRQIYDAVAEEL